MARKTVSQAVASRLAEGATDGFLAGVALRQVGLPANSPFTEVGLALGQGPSALEVLIVRCGTDPQLPIVRSAWKVRKGGRASPLILVVLHNGKATLCGPSGDEPPVYPSLDFGQADRICREALEQPDRHAALRLLRDILPSIESALPGVRNEGFLANHELVHGARELHAWSEAGEKARRVLGNRGEQLIRSLGFEMERCDQVTSILRAADRKVAIGVLLNQSESPELQADRFSGLSPVSYALAVADRENLPYVMVLQDSKLRLYPVKLGVGVGRRGRTETYVEIHTNLLRDADAAYLWLLFSAEAILQDGTLDQLIEESGRFAGELAEKLRERIYNFVVPALAQGLACARGMENPTAQDLAETYEMAMTVLFRLLFIAYAEDKDLLPYQWNDLHKRRSLKTKAIEIQRLDEQGVEWTNDDSLWEEVTRVFRAVEEGKPEWAVPAYNGGLFSRDPQVSKAGALLAEVSLPNTVMGPVLKDLLLLGTGPVDFRSLSVGEFGTIYEGLLESELSVAETNLTMDENGFYRPCTEGEEPIIHQQHIYLHNRSGARKSTGTYYTKPFAVKHLLDHALEPALTEHLARLDELDDDEAAERFFDFRVADIAMGSGHFLVEAIDRIERRLTGYLSRRKLPGVRHELATLRAAALSALGSLAEQVEIEDTQLLRRLLTKRCIYGVDINPIAVQLARLAIWIHTFVPGLPLSLLDHNLVCGNSLVGIGRVEELRDIADPEGGSLFALDAQTLVGEALEPLTRLARLADTTPTELRRARQAMEQARRALAPAEALCDIATASRMRGEALPADLGKWEEVKETLAGSRAHQQSRAQLKDLSPLHFAIAFPEVFLRDRPGFDVIIGNPPWQEATLEEHAFWARHVPGLRALSQRQQEEMKSRLRGERADLVTLYEQELAEAETLRAALTTGPYPGMGTGDPDLYKAFCWRFWHLIAADGGRLGVVLPRSALAAMGSTPFREEILAHADPLDITMMVNNRQWVFPDVHPQYTIGLIGICRSEPDGRSVKLRGPFASLDRYRAGMQKAPAEFTGEEVMGWTDTASLPLLPTEESLDIFAQLRKAPRLDLNDRRSWRARPHTELHATNDKNLMDLESEVCPQGYWPVYKGESFEIWNPDTGTYYAWAEPEAMLEHLQRKRERAGGNRRSAFFEFEPKWLRNPDTQPCYSARLAFRDISRSTDSRTVRIALVPPEVFIANQAPFLLWPRGGEEDQAYLLGVLASIPLDWYARRFVETHVNFYVFNPFPIPHPVAGDAQRQRVIELAGRLACPDKRFAEWAKAVGVECGPLEVDEKDDMIHELDAVVAHLYGLKQKQLVHIFETFHEGWDYADRLRATLVHFREWRKKLKSVI